jgi:hypothetical protein
LVEFLQGGELFMHVDIVAHHSSVLSSSFRDNDPSRIFLEIIFFTDMQPVALS